MGGALALGPCPAIPRAGGSSGCQPGWDSLVRRDESPGQWDGEAVAVLALRELHHGGFTIDSCCTGTAPVGTAR